MPWRWLPPAGRLHGARVHQRRDLGVERVVYRVVGVDPKADQRWSVYAASVLAFSLVSVVGLYALQRFQANLPLSSGFPGVDPALAFNTAVSFVTNTNWQAYSGEATMGHLVQMAGLAVQNFVSAAVGIAVAIALIRGFTRSQDRSDRQLLGRPGARVVRILLPLAVIAAIVLIALGAIQNLSSGTDVDHAGRGAPDHHRRTGRLAGGDQGARHQRRRLLQRQLRPPVREPDALSNIFENFLLLLIPVALTRTFGVMVGDKRQGYAILADDGRDLGHARGRGDPLEVAPPRHGPPGGRGRHGGQGDPVRRVGLGAVRRLHDGYVDRRGQLVPRLVHQRRRRLR